MTRAAGRFRPGWAGGVGAVLLAGFVAVAVVGSFHGDPLTLDAAPLTPPNGQHPFGTDALGRDLLARTGHGAATSAWVALSAVGLATLIALPIGVLTGWYHRRPGATLVTWTVELAQVVPPFVLVVVLLGLTADEDRRLLGVGLTPAWRLILSLAVAFVPFLSRVIRAATVAELAQEYVDGLRLIGVRRREILAREVVPNLVPTITVQVLLALSIAVFAEGGLSYLGLGIPAPHPTLGNLIAEAGTQLLDDAWWYALIPGIVLVAGITGTNLLADGGTDRLLGNRRPGSGDEVDAVVDRSVDGHAEGRAENSVDAGQRTPTPTAAAPKVGGPAPSPLPHPHRTEAVR